jgi:hypothetical protein
VSEPILERATLQKVSMKKEKERGAEDRQEARYLYRALVA